MIMAAVLGRKAFSTAARVLFHTEEQPYSCLENTKTDMLRETVSYHKDIKTKRIVKSYVDNNVDVLAKVLKHPTVTNAKIIDGEIKIDVDFEILAEVIGETKMQVTVFT